MQRNFIRQGKQRLMQTEISSDKENNHPYIQKFHQTRKTTIDTYRNFIRQGKQRSIHTEISSDKENNTRYTHKFCHTRKTTIDTYRNFIRQGKQRLMHTEISSYKGKQQGSQKCYHTNTTMIVTLSVHVTVMTCRCIGGGLIN